MMVWVFMYIQFPTSVLASKNFDTPFLYPPSPLAGILRPRGAAVHPVLRDFASGCLIQTYHISIANISKFIVIKTCYEVYLHDT